MWPEDGVLSASVCWLEDRDPHGAAAVSSGPVGALVQQSRICFRAQATPVCVLRVTWLLEKTGLLLHGDMAVPALMGCWASHWRRAMDNARRVASRRGQVSEVRKVTPAAAIGSHAGTLSIRPSD